MRIAALLFLASLLASCAAHGLDPATDRCYLSLARYEPLRDLYEETGSWQVVEQVMDEEKWAPCERNQMRYWLAKSLYLDELAGEAALAPAR